ncbi:MAG: DUF3795 domain-containing protein [Anaerolineae bacterium]|nr:DUF3795 domain-containing protein [Anaerolineae bacterium]
MTGELGNCHRRRLAAVCGRYCGTCEEYVDRRCCGCGYSLGRGCEGDCELFLCCVVERGLPHCGLCVDFPCQVYLSHARAPVVAVRIKALHHRVEIGTERWLDEQEQQAGNK